MKSFWRKLGLLSVGLMTFGYAAVCEAENWVLWKNVVNQTAHENSWDKLGTFPSHDVCMQESNKNESSTAVFENAVNIGKGNLLVTKDDGSTELISYMCLAEAIDPRK